MKKLYLAMIIICCTMLVQGVFGKNSADQSKIKFDASSDKLIDGDAIFQAFEDGQKKVKVLVTLSTPFDAKSKKPYTENLRLERSVKIANQRRSVMSVLNSNDFSLRHGLENSPVFSCEVNVQGLNKLLANPEVLYIEPIRLATSNTAQGIPQMHADGVPRTTYGGSGIAIAVCDTGVDYTHSKLGGSGNRSTDFPNNKVIGGYDWGGSTSNINDKDSDPFPTATSPAVPNPHGTQVSGVAAGAVNTGSDYIGGVAPNAKIYAVKISYDSSPTETTSEIYAAAWDWCVTHRNDDTNNPIKVISNTFGWCCSVSPEHGDASSAALASAASSAVSAGITVVVSAGNNGQCNGLINTAAMTNTISVGAVYDGDHDAVSYCLWGSACANLYTDASCPSGWMMADCDPDYDQVALYSNTADFLDVLAPCNIAATLDIVGTSGDSTGDYYCCFGGTSASSPYVAGAVACLQSAAKDLLNRYLTPAEVRTILTTTGDPILDEKVAIVKPRVNVQNAFERILEMVDNSGDLVLHYDFDEAFGEPNVYDNEATLDATLNLGVIRVPSDPDFKGVVGFPGLTSTKTNVRAEWLNPPMASGDFTMAVMFRNFDPMNASNQIVMGWDGLGIGVVSGYLWGTWAAVGTDSQVHQNDITYADTWVDRDWHHVAMTYDNSAYTRKLYFDGELVGTDVLNSSYGAGQGHWEKIFVIGGRQDSYSAEGLCADAKVWDVVLDDTQVLSEYLSLLTQCKKPGDIDNDEVVDVNDLSILADNWDE